MGTIKKIIGFLLIIIVLWGTLKTASVYTRPSTIAVESGPTFNGDEAASITTTQTETKTETEQNKTKLN